MTQHDMTVNNQGFPNFRADMNNALKALASSASGGTQPGTRYPNQLWADTSNNLLKIRNTANTAWITLFPLSGLDVADEFSAADLLALLLTADGAGTGLDADLLDGQHGTYYRNANNINAGTLAIARLAIASQAEAEAATDATKLMTPERVGQAIEELAPVESIYESANLTMISGQQTWTLAHGLGRRPIFFQASVICVIASVGYSVGDEVMVASVYTSDPSDGVGIYLGNDTQISVLKGTNLRIGRSNVAWASISTSTEIGKWRLKVRAR